MHGDENCTPEAIAPPGTSHELSFRASEVLTEVTEGAESVAILAQVVVAFFMADTLL